MIGKMANSRMTKNIEDKNFVVVCDAEDLLQDAEFSNFLTDEMRHELGEINASWFDEAFSDSNLPAESAEANETAVGHGGSPDLQKESSITSSVVESPIQTPHLFGWSPITQGNTKSQGLCHSTPSQLAVSLGASMGGHDMSWTSSMATPLTAPARNICNKGLTLSEDLGKSQGVEETDDGRIFGTPDLIRSDVTKESEDPVSSDTESLSEEMFSPPDKRLKQMESVEGNGFPEGFAGIPRCGGGGSRSIPSACCEGSAKSADVCSCEAVTGIFKMQSGPSPVRHVAEQGSRERQREDALNCAGGVGEEPSICSVVGDAGCTSVGHVAVAATVRKVSDSRTCNDVSTPKIQRRCSTQRKWNARKRPVFHSSQEESTSLKVESSDICGAGDVVQPSTVGDTCHPDQKENPWNKESSDDGGLSIGDMMGTEVAACDASETTSRADDRVPADDECEAVRMQLPPHGDNSGHQVASISDSDFTTTAAILPAMCSDGTAVSNGKPGTVESFDELKTSAAAARATSPYVASNVQNVENAACHFAFRNGLEYDDDAVKSEGFDGKEVHGPPLTSMDASDGCARQQITSLVESEHDYAKPSAAPSQQTSTAADYDDGYDSHFTQLLEVVDSSTACIESLMNEEFAERVPYGSEGHDAEQAGVHVDGVSETGCFQSAEKQGPSSRLATRIFSIARPKTDVENECRSKHCLGPPSAEQSSKTSARDVVTKPEVPEGSMQKECCVPSSLSSRKRSKCDAQGASIYDRCELGGSDNRCLSGMSSDDVFWDPAFPDTQLLISCGHIGDSDADHSSGSETCAAFQGRGEKKPGANWKRCGVLLANVSVTPRNVPQSASNTLEGGTPLAPSTVCGTSGLERLASVAEEKNSSGSNGSPPVATAAAVVVDASTGRSGVQVKLFAGRRTSALQSLTSVANSVNCLRGFVAAVGKSIAVSETSLQKTNRATGAQLNRLLREESPPSLMDKRVCPLKAEMPRLPVNYDPGCDVSRANNNSVVGSESLPKAASRSGGSMACPVSADATASAEKAFTGFSTASGNAVNVSKKALEAASRRLSELTSEMNAENLAHHETVDVCVSRADESPDSAAVGVKCDGKPLTKLPRHVEFPKLSSLLLNDRASKVSSCQSGSSDGPPKGIVGHQTADGCCPRLTAGQSFRGFQTASGKAVQVSLASLERAKRSYQECLNHLKQEESLPSDGGGDVGSAFPVPVVNLPHNKGHFQGFSTASGKAVTVSKKSLEMARRWHDDVIASVDGSGERHSSRTKRRSTEFGSKNPAAEVVPSAGHQLGFTTATGKPVSVSEKSLERAESMYRRYLQEVAEEENHGSGSVGGGSPNGGSAVVPKWIPLAGTPERDATGTKGAPPDCAWPDTRVEDAGGAGGDTAVSNRCSDGRTVARGVKRSRSFSVEEGDERPCKISSKRSSNNTQESAGVEGDDIFPRLAAVEEDPAGASQIEKFELATLGKMLEISEDSLDAAEALIAMSNSHNHLRVSTPPGCATPSFGGGACDASSKSSSDRPRQTVAAGANRKPPRGDYLSARHEVGDAPRSDSVSDLHVGGTSGTAAGVRGVTGEKEPAVPCVPFKSLCSNVSVNLSANDLSVEVLESTSAFLEDECHTDGSASKDVCSFEDKGSPGGPKLCVLDPRLASANLHNACNELPCAKANSEILCEECGSPVNTAREHVCVVARSTSKGLHQEERLSDAVGAPEVSKLLPDELHHRRYAIEGQLSEISRKASAKIAAAVPSQWYLKKSEKCGRVSLRLFANRCRPCRVTDKVALSCGVKKSTLKVCSRNAEAFRFSHDEHFGGALDPLDGIVELGDGATLILNDCNAAGKEEFYRALVCCPGVDPRLVSRAWVNNHYRWIVWKLAAMEISFPSMCAGRFLTPARVLAELLYRVNCEIDFSRRSALKRIAERDDTPMKTMILCVADVVHLPSLGRPAGESQPGSVVENEVYLEVTDGWYSVKAALDDPLKKLVELRKICVGQKLVVHGAEIVGASDACPPLEVPASQFLKLNYNSCRRARWYAKLGYFTSPQPFPLPLNSFVSNGGLIACVDVSVVRTYPMQFLEKLPDGSFVMLNGRMNELIGCKAETRKSSLMDKLFADVQSDLELEECGRVRKRRQSLGGKSFSPNEIKVLFSGEEIAEALKNAVDPSFVESCLSSSQKESLVKHNLAANERKQAQMLSKLTKMMQMKQDSGEFPADREVVPLLKVRAAGCHAKDHDGNKTCLVTIWRPSEDVIRLLEEGRGIKMYYLMAERRSSGKELHVKSTKMTKFEELSNDDGAATAGKAYEQRKFSPFGDLLSTNFQPLYGELDVIGVVVSVGNVGLPKHSKFEIAFLANGDQDLVGVKFWGGLKAFGVETTLRAGSFIASHNLCWRGRERSPIPFVHASELSVFTHFPKDCDGKQQLDALRNSIKDVNAFLEKCKEKICRAMQGEPLSAANVSPAVRPFLPKCASTPDAPRLWQNSNFLQAFGADSPGDLRACSALHRMSHLQRMGAPPQLGPLPGISSPMVCSKYKVPLEKGSVN